MKQVAIMGTGTGTGSDHGNYLYLSKKNNRTGLFRALERHFWSSKPSCKQE